MRLDGNSVYEYYPLGTKSNTYNASLSATNSWYYSRLYSFDHNTSSTIALLTLLSPQIQADTEGPLISYDNIIRIPVYQKQRINLQKYIQDISGVAKVYVDSDLTKDTDGDGNLSNDQDSLDANTTYGIKK